MLRNYPVFEMGMKELAEEITELFLIIKKKKLSWELSEG